uniref:RING-type domain-containing protein n=1 Tax=Parastrongyloides trichosuri TaxID=131310 RepID=A0A0N4ZNV8_PARTI
MSSSPPPIFNCQLICYQDFTEKDLCVNINCGHLLHYVCMKRWLNISHSCPKCSIPTYPDEIIKVYYDETLNNMFSNYYRGKYEKLKEKVDSDLKIDDSTNIKDNKNSCIKDDTTNEEKILNQERTIKNLIKKQENLQERIIQLTDDRARQLFCVSNQLSRLINIESLKRKISNQRTEINNLKSIKEMLEIQNNELLDEINEMSNQESRIITLENKVYNQRNNIKFLIAKNKKLRYELDNKTVILNATHERSQNIEDNLLECIEMKDIKIDNQRKEILALRRKLNTFQYRE